MIQNNYYVQYSIEYSAYCVFKRVNVCHSEMMYHCENEKKANEIMAKKIKKDKRAKTCMVTN